MMRKRSGSRRRNDFATHTPWKADALPVDIRASVGQEIESSGIASKVDPHLFENCFGVVFDASEPLVGEGVVGG